MSSITAYLLAAIVVLLVCVGSSDAVATTTGHVCYAAGANAAATWTTSATSRTVTNGAGLPAFEVTDYCPFGQGGLYCGTYQYCPSGNYGTNGSLCTPANWGNTIATSGSAWGTVASDAASSCPRGWSTLTCPQQSAAISGGYYDCPASGASSYSVALNPLPVRQSVGPSRVAGMSCGVALDGVVIADSFEASGQTLDAAHIVQDKCNGHTTPGMTNAMYHYHRPPVCATTNTTGLPYSETPGKHSPLLGYGRDGFGLYGFQDEGGSGNACSVTCSGSTCTDNCNSTNFETCHCGGGRWTGDNFCKTTGNTGRCERKPIVDGCGGHFGPTPGSLTTLTYHYHSRMDPPFTLGCFGPSWGACSTLYASGYAGCATECATANLKNSLCVASGYVDQFDINAVTFGSGYSAASSLAGRAVLAVAACAAVVVSMLAVLL